MQLLVGQQKQNQLLGLAIVVGLLLIAPGHCQINKGNDDNKSSVVVESSGKKALIGENSPPHLAEVIMQGPKKETDPATAGSPSDKPKIEQKNEVATPPNQPQEPTKKTGSSNSQTAIDNKTSNKPKQDASPTATSSSSSNLYHHEEESILNSDEEISDSLMGGFYFFVALSLSAITFIIFKVYRLRLSRAERKYGVQGDRSTQELTPLPTAIEDVASDDEDQTLFEVQRQNIRIL